MSWSRPSEALPLPLSFHPHTPRDLPASCTGFDEHITTVSDKPDVQNADTTVACAAAAASLRLAIVPPPCLPPLDQRELEPIIDIAYGCTTSSGSAPAASCPLSFRAGLAGPQIAAARSLCSFRVVNFQHPADHFRIWVLNAKTETWPGATKIAIEGRYGWESHFP